MNPRMTSNMLTAWRPEKDGRAVSWERIGSMRCRWDRSGAVSASPSGDATSLSVDMVISCRDDDAPLKPKDKVALGVRIGADPPADALTVTGCHPVFLGGVHPHHWEAFAS